MRRSDTLAQCSVQRFNVRAVHVGAGVLKRPPGEGDMTKRLEISYTRLGQKLEFPVDAQNL